MFTACTENAGLKDDQASDIALTTVDVPDALNEVSCRKSLTTLGAKSGHQGLSMNGIYNNSQHQESLLVQYSQLHTEYLASNPLKGYWTYAEGCLWKHRYAYQPYVPLPTEGQASSDSRPPSCYHDARQTVFSLEYYRDTLEFRESPLWFMGGVE